MAELVCFVAAAADLKVGAVVSQARRTALASLGYDEDTKGIDLINMVNNWDETYNNTLDEPERMVRRASTQCMHARP